MRFASTIVVFALGGSGCDNGKMHLHPPDSNRDAYEAPWWTPMPGEARNWDIQLDPAVFDFSAARDMYVVDLWNVATPTTLDYGDGSPVTVPAGPQAGKIAEIKARGAKVICRVGTGAIRLTDPDAMKFPGYEAAPPDRPNLPTAGSSIGWTTNEPMERFLDIRAASRPMWESRIWKRFDLAKQLGCDGIEHDWVFAIGGLSGAPDDSGWMAEVSDQSSFGADVAMQAHDRELSSGMQNGTLITDAFSPNFDWLLVERCGEFRDCRTMPFTNLRKAVFALEYTTDEFGDPQAPDAPCSGHVNFQIEDGLVKDLALSSAFRHQCVP
jgi:hypothetical protein